MFVQNVLYLEITLMDIFTKIFPGKALEFIVVLFILFVKIILLN